jgi:hypothetical protein
VSRYRAIAEVIFAGLPLGLASSLRIRRRREPLPACGDDQAFTSSLQVGPSTILVDLHIRDLPAAEALELGQAGELSFQVLSCQDDSRRSVRLAGAVLVGIETLYQQDAPATAVLSFAAESADGLTDPFTAGDQP